MASRFTFTVPADVQHQREALQRTLREAASKGSLEAIQAAQDELRAWLEVHPDDYAMWDAGEPLALLADALQAPITEPAHVS